jgi:hypothetical protein
MNKKSKIEFKLDECLFLKYKSYCESNGYDMSKRLRMFIESEVPKNYKLIKVDNIIYEPIIEVDIINIMDINFPLIKSSPNVFVIITSDTISENISFYFNNKKYNLEGVSITKEEDDNILIECRKYLIEYF